MGSSLEARAREHPQPTYSVAESENVESFPALRSVGYTSGQANSRKEMSKKKARKINSEIKRLPFR